MRNHALDNVGYDSILRGPASVSAARAVILSTLFSLSLATSHTVRADDVNSSCSTGGIQIPGIADVNLNALVVNTPGPRELVIHYSAECQVQDGYIEYDVLVNGVEVLPSNDNFSALCSAPQSPATVGPTLYFRAPAAGNYSITVRGHIENGLGPGLVDDHCLVVEEEAP
ncbi:MAG: hypothetical protein ACREYF_04055 [Gammaproteobacteria bacterium]